MTLWEYTACVDGLRRLNGGEDEAEPPSPEDHLKMVQMASRAMH